MRFRNWFFAGIVWVLLVQVVVAQPKAVIVAPTVTEPGELTVVSSTGSVGDNLTWIRPEGLTTVEAGCELLDSQLFFSTAKEGVYEFILIVADKESRIDFARHSVKVVKGGGIGPVDPPPVDPPTQPTPAPVPPNKWTELKTLSKSGADRVGDNEIRPLIRNAISEALTRIESQCAVQQCPTLDEAKSQVSAAIDRVLLSRASRFADWAANWREPNAAEVQRVRVIDLKDYIEAAKAIREGL